LFGLGKKKKAEEAPPELTIPASEIVKRLEEAEETRALRMQLPPKVDDDTPVFTSLDEVFLGAVYMDVVSGFIGTCESKIECMTGCDRVTLAATARSGMREIECDITHLAFLDIGVHERFAKIKNPPSGTDVPAPAKGAPTIVRW